MTYTLFSKVVFKDDLYQGTQGQKTVISYQGILFISSMTDVFAAFHVYNSSFLCNQMLYESF